MPRLFFSKKRVGMEKIRSAVSNSYFVLALALVGIFIGYLLRIFLSRTLTLEEFGLFYAVSAFIGLFTLVRYLGLNQALAKFIPEFLIRNERGNIKSSIAIVLVIQTLTIIAFIMLVFAFREQISLSFFKSPAAEPVLVLMMLSFFPSMFFTIFQSVFQGFQKLKLYASVEPVRILFTFAFSIIFIDMGATGVAIAYLIAACVTTAILFRNFYGLGVTKVKSKVSYRLARKLLGFGVPVFVSSIAAIVISYTDTIVITFYRTLQEVALYQVALPTSQLLLVFSGSIAAVAFPLISELYSRKRYKDVEKGVRIMSVLLMAMIMPFVAVLATFPETIIVFLFGDSFILASFTLQVLSVSMIFYSVFVIFQTTLDGIGKPFVTTKLMFSMAAINLILNLLLVPVLGITGSAFASLIAYLSGAVIGMRYVSIHAGVTLPFRRLAKIIGSGAIAAAVMHSLRALLTLPILAEFILSVVAGIAAYIAAASVLRAITFEDIKFIESKGSIPGPVRKIARFLFRQSRGVVV